MDQLQQDHLAEVFGRWKADNLESYLQYNTEE